jgi:hypothetical protein
MKKNQDLLFALFFSFAGLGFLFFIVQNIFDVINNGFTLWKGVVIITQGFLVFNLARAGLLFFKRGRDLDFE